MAQITNSQRKSAVNHAMNRAAFIMNLAIWIHENRETLSDRNVEFDYPDYCGMPKKMFRQLSTMHVDIIQDNKGMLPPTVRGIIDMFTGF